MKIYLIILSLCILNMYGMETTHEMPPNQGIYLANDSTEVLDVGYFIEDSENKLHLTHLKTLVPNTCHFFADADNLYVQNGLLTDNYDISELCQANPELTFKQLKKTAGFEKITERSFLWRLHNNEIKIGRKDDQIFAVIPLIYNHRIRPSTLTIFESRLSTYSSLSYNLVVKKENECLILPRNEFYLAIYASLANNIKEITATRYLQRKEIPTLTNLCLSLVYYNKLPTSMLPLDLTERLNEIQNSNPALQIEKLVMTKPKKYKFAKAILKKMKDHFSTLLKKKE